MELKQDTIDFNKNQINRYDADSGIIVVNDIAYHHSILLSPHKIKLWSAQSITSLCDKDFLEIIEEKPLIFLLGTGPKQLFPPIEILAPCIQANIPVDIMDTGAACRTFNLLVAESRPVLAAMIP